MVTSRLYLDMRRPDKEGRGRLRLAIQKNGRCSYLGLGVALLPCQWEDEKVIEHPNAKMLNLIIQQKKTTVEQSLLELSALGQLTGKSTKEISVIIKGILDPDYALHNKEKDARSIQERNSFILYYQSFCSRKQNLGTKTLYKDTLKKIESFCRTRGLESIDLSFSMITKQWLEGFERFCLCSERQNTVSRHLRDIRAAINAAIDDNLTNNYPFRRFRIKVEETIDKSYTAAELRTLFTYRCYPGCQEESVDMFKLMFCLIGINSVDLAYAQPLERGRLNYVRRKTAKTYTIKVEPEALKIIEKYPGTNHLLNIIERVPNYKTYFNRMGKALRKVGLTRIPGAKSRGKPILADICNGSARTSWATIAQDELGIPRDVIAAALGHHTVDVTTTYLRTDWKRKVDEANRKVLDWVFYGKRL